MVETGKCWVSFNASLTLPRHASNCGSDPAGIRFECTWNNAPDATRRAATAPGGGGTGDVVPVSVTSGRNHYCIRTHYPPPPPPPPLPPPPPPPPPPPAKMPDTLLWNSARKNSSSGYGSGEGSSSFLAATLTLTNHAGSVAGSSAASLDVETPVRRTPQAYERRCRSTCSITLQTSADEPDGSMRMRPEVNYPLKPRSTSEGDGWDSHSRLHQLIQRSTNGKMAPQPPPPPSPPPPLASADSVPLVDGEHSSRSSSLPLPAPGASHTKVKYPMPKHNKN